MAILSLRGSQEMGVDATYGICGIIDLLASQLPDSGLLHYIHQASLEISQLFTPLVEFSTLFQEVKRAENTKETLQAPETGLVAPGRDRKRQKKVEEEE